MAQRTSKEEQRRTECLQQLNDMLESDQVKKLQNMLGGLNFFELCGMNKQETKHSYFLLNLFDVHGKHGWGDAFARAFCDMAGLNLQERFFTELKSESIRREYKFKNNESRVDLLLYADNTVILIENKVDAGLHDDQLSKYENGVDVDSMFKGYRKYYVFLTKDGRFPETGNVNWISVSYGQIIEAICKAQQRAVPGKEADEYKIIIEHYIKFLRSEVIMNIDDFDTEAKQLYKEMQNRYPEAVAFLSKTFRDEKIIAVSQKISEILQQEADKRKLRLSGKCGIVGLGRVQFKTERLEQAIKKMSANSENPFFYEISIDGSSQNKKIMKAYAYARGANATDSAYNKIRQLCAEYETSRKRAPLTGKEAHILKLHNDKAIDVYDIYEKMTAVSAGDKNLGEETLRSFVIDVLDEIEQIEKEIEAKL